MDMWIYVTVDCTFDVILGLVQIQDEFGVFVGREGSFLRGVQFYPSKKLVSCCE